MTLRVTGARISRTYDRIIEHFNGWYEDANTLTPKMSAGTANNDEIRRFYDRTVGVRDAAHSLVQSVSNARLVAYAKVDQDDDTYEIAGFYTATRAALLNVINEFDNNFVWKADDSSAQAQVPAVYTDAETTAVRGLIETAVASMS